MLFGGLATDVAAGGLMLQYGYSSIAVHVLSLSSVTLLQRWWTVVLVAMCAAVWSGLPPSTLGWFKWAVAYEMVQRSTDEMLKLLLWL